MTSPESGFVRDVMTKVITGTDQAMSRMEAENRVVMSIAERLPMVNVSGAGNNLATSIGEWTQSYNIILQKLQDLNNRATQTRDTLTNAADSAISASNR